MLCPGLLNRRAVDRLQHLNVHAIETHLLPRRDGQAAVGTAHFSTRLEHRQTRRTVQTLHHKTRAQCANTAVFGDHPERPISILGHVQQDFPAEQTQGTALGIKLQVDRRTSIQADPATVR
ncbi:hypothetical protein D3C75_1051480 [compost metagenome]